MTVIHAQMLGGECFPNCSACEVRRETPLELRAKLEQHMSEQLRGVLDAQRESLLAVFERLAADYERTADGCAYDMDAREAAADIRALVAKVRRTEP